MSVKDHIGFLLKKHNIVQIMQELSHRKRAGNLHPQVMIDAVARKEDPVLF